MGVLDSLVRAGGLSVSSLITYSLITVVVTMVVSWIIKRQKMIAMIEKIPGPRAIPILGNALEVNVEPREMFQQIIGYTHIWSQRVSLHRIWAGPFPMISTYTASNVEVILSSNKHIDKSRDYNFLHPWLGTGLLTSTGSKWKSRRKTLTPTFHFKILEDFVDVFNVQASKLVTKLTPVADGDVVNMFPFVTCATLDIICETAMGVSPNAQDHGDSEYVQAVYKLNSLIQKRQARPWLHPNILFYLLGYGAQHDKCLNVLHGFTNKAIAQRKKIFNENKIAEKKEKEEDDIGKKKRLAFLDLLLDISDNGANLSDLDIREEVDTFMFEGHDTTSAAISWSLYLIGANPEVQ
ncbi:unnamed protein product, partial [Meganyctiphanes norvegica]